MQKKLKVPQQGKFSLREQIFSDLKNSLIKRGWVENNTGYFDLQFTIQMSDIDLDQLKPNQITNHYEFTDELCTKIGLLYNLRNLMWVSNSNYNEFYPKCFDLSDPDDFDYFQREFQIYRAVAILKMHLRLSQNKEAQQLKQFETYSNIAFQVCQRYIEDWNESIDKPEGYRDFQILDFQWDIMQQDLSQFSGEYCNIQSLSLATHSDANEEYESHDGEIQYLDGDEQFQMGEESQQERKENVVLTNQPLIEEVYQQILELNPKFQILREDNIWILQPGAQSRGRGIKLAQSLQHIKQEVYQQTKFNWVIQQYVQNPLLYAQQKFDIRQLILISSVDPLTIWFYDECYLRFGTQEYSPQDIEDKFSHLTNNSINQLNENVLEPGVDYIYDQGNMLTQNDLIKILGENCGFKNGETGIEIFKKIQNQMKQIVIDSMKCVQDKFRSRSLTYQLFGYDFLIDENIDLWLMEVNSSPSLQYSSQLKERIVKELSDDLLKVIIDYNLDKSQDTGHFKLIYEGEKLHQPKSGNFKEELVVVGKQIK